MSMVLRWRVPDRAIVTRWRGPEGLADAVARAPDLPIAAVIGPPGPTGATGATGPAGMPLRIDATLSSTWILSHGLGHIPMVQVFLTAAGSGGEQAIADVEATATTITVTHASPQSGFVLAY